MKIIAATAARIFITPHHNRVPRRGASTLHASHGKWQNGEYSVVGGGPSSTPAALAMRNAAKPTIRIRMELCSPVSKNKVIFYQQESQILSDNF
jgi:hypothetical protein